MHASCQYLCRCQNNRQHHVLNLNFVFIILRVTRFERFSVEAHSACAYDYLAIYDGMWTDPQRIIGRYCGSVIPADIISNGSNLVVNFFSDASVVSEGFSLEYMAIYGKF